MTINSSFYQANEETFETLEQYVPIVARVHGGSHPEFLQVKEIYDAIYDKVKNASDEQELSDEFAKLRVVTDNYNVPNDVCETYATVFQLLKALDNLAKI